MTPTKGSKRFEPGPHNTRLLRDAFGHFATGVTVVTTMTKAGPMAITANSFASISLDPPLVMWAPGRHARRFRHFEEAEHYAIHVLAADQDSLCFAVAKDATALTDVPHHHSPEGVPLIDGCLACFECRREASHEGGDHLLVIGRVLRAEMQQHRDALAFFRGKMQRIRSAAPDTGSGD